MAAPIPLWLHKRLRTKKLWSSEHLLFAARRAMALRKGIVTCNPAWLFFVSLETFPCHSKQHQIPQSIYPNQSIYVSPK